MKSNGFTLIEVMFALSVLLTLLLSILPVMAKVSIEESILSDRRKVLSVLHDELLAELNEPVMLTSPVTIHASPMIQLTFEKHSDLIKGCATWTNKRKQEEKVCLYGYPSI